LRRRSRRQEEQLAAERDRQAEQLAAEGERQAEQLAAEGERQAEQLAAEGERHAEQLAASFRELRLEHAQQRELQDLTEVRELLDEAAEKLGALGQAYVRAADALGLPSSEPDADARADKAIERVEELGPQTIRASERLALRFSADDRLVREYRATMEALDGGRHRFFYRARPLSDPEIDAVQERKREASLHHVSFMRLAHERVQSRLPGSTAQPPEQLDLSERA
jgi:regulator of protease activity HflC (stomatin/prohibitin superfamily)